MGLDKLCNDPEFVDYGDDLPAVSPFISGLDTESNFAAQLTRAMYYHVNVQYPYDSQFSKPDISLDKCMSYIGQDAWKNMRDMMGCNSEDFWESIYTFLSAPQASAPVSLGQILLI